jgi:hypothetical protein
MSLTSRRRFRISCALLLALSILAPIPILEMVSSAATGALRIVSGVRLKLINADEQESAGQNDPARLAPQRLKISERGKREILFDEPVVSATVIDPEMVAAEVTGERRVTVSGLRVGETILIISGRNIRRTFAVNVSRPAAVAASKLDGGARAPESESISGFYNFYYAPSLEDGSSLMRHRFEFRYRMPDGRAVRASGEVFKFLGGAPGFSLLPGAKFGANRLTLGLDSKDIRLDVLDSELEFSQPGFNSLTMRGAHLVSRPDSRLRGLELFAGIARPTSVLFGTGEGRIAGGIIPIATGASWRWRAGVFALKRGQGRLPVDGGVVWQTDARYAPDEKTLVEGEAGYSGGALSWRARLNLRRGAYNFFGETARVDAGSPLAAVGARSGGQAFHSLGARWQPESRLSLFVNYSRTTSTPLRTSQHVPLDGSTFQAGVNYRVARDSSLGVNFTQQELETPASSVNYLLQLQTRTLTLRYSTRFEGRWANDFQARIISSSEADAGAGMNNGISIREQLRYSGQTWSATAYAGYTRNTPSLESLVLRNPGLLPRALRPAFESNPARFLAAYREELHSLLDGVELPLTRNMEMGARLRAAFSRYRLTSEVRYDSGEILAHERRRLQASFGIDVRLDSANSLQVSGAHSFAFDTTGNQSAFSVSFTHRFGIESGGGGFSLPKLLGLNRGHIQGRAFFDLNGNGQDDPGEPGLAGMKIQLDGGRSVTTDGQGRYRFGSLAPGEYSLALLSEQLGVGLRASTATEKRVSLSARQTATVSFGVMNFGLVSGRVFNDLFLSGSRGDAFNAPGVNGVRLVLRSLNEAVNSSMQAVSLDPDGTYIFRNLLPGTYQLELDTTTLPADFQLPEPASWTVKVDPLQGFYLDIPLAAQRAVSGTVFIDHDGDGRFDPRKDVAVVGARVTCGKSEALTASGGSYLLRNLPAGRIEVRARTPWGVESPAIVVELGADPATRRDVNLLITR